MGSGSGGHNMNMDDILNNLRCFGDIFGGGRKRKRSHASSPEPKRGHDLYKEVSVTLKDAYLGKKRKSAFIITLVVMLVTEKVWNQEQK